MDNYWLKYDDSDVKSYFAICCSILISDVTDIQQGAVGWLDFYKEDGSSEYLRKLSTVQEYAEIHAQTGTQGDNGESAAWLVIHWPSLLVCVPVCKLTVKCLSAWRQNSWSFNTLLRFVSRLIEFPVQLNMVDKLDHYWGETQKIRSFFFQVHAKSLCEKIVQVLILSITHFIR